MTTIQTKLTFVLLLLFCIPNISFSQSKMEIDLRHQLDVANGKLDVANKSLTKAESDRVAALALNKQIAQSTANNNAKLNNVATKVVQAQQVAQSNDNDARETADATQQILNQAAKIVKDSSDVVAKNSTKVQNSANANWSVLIVQFFLFLSVIAGFVYKGFERKWDRDDIENKNKQLNEKLDHTAATQVKQVAKLDQIHTLVNSALTASLADQLDARKAYLVVLNESSNKKPSAETLGFIDKTKEKIDELETALANRLEDTKRAEAQLKIDMKKTDANSNNNNNLVPVPA
jgi:hypothetical protein